MQYHGSCHCGRIQYDVEGELTQVIECNCSHCSRKGYLLWFVPRQQLKLQVEETALATYTFNKHAIQHHFCPQCGCAPFGFGKDKSAVETAAVNVRCLEGVEISTLQKRAVDGRSF